MYDERRDSFTIKDIILQLLFIILLVFILIWLFPTKGYLETRLDGINNKVAESLKPLYTRLFTDNIMTMKEQAKSYYTTPRLPQKVGDKTKMTLGEMYEKGLLLEIVDSNNKACDTEKSYVELTKMEDEYQLKVVLSCSDKEAFVIEYLGCYDYCNGKLCSKADTTTTQVKKYRYQYVLSIGGTCTDFGAWSDWTQNKIEASDNVKVDTKTERVLVGYNKVWDVVDTKTVDEKYNEEVSFGYSTRTIKKTTTYNYTTKSTTKVVPYSTTSSSKTTTIPYSERTLKKTTTYNYTTKSTTKVVPYSTKVATKDTIGPFSTRTLKKTTLYTYTITKTPTGTTWVDAGTYGPTKEIKSSTSTVRYTAISSYEDFDCSANPCKTVIYTTYKVEKAQTTYTEKKSCPENARDTGSGCEVVTYTTDYYCPVGTKTDTGCLIKADQTVLYCPEGKDNGSGCAITTTEKYCAQGEDTGSGCAVVTYTTEKYCSQGTDNGSGCTVTANQNVNYCPEGVDNGTGCKITTVTKYCSKGEDTGTNCVDITYEKQNYCATGTDTGSGCVKIVEKTKPVTQFIYGWVEKDPIYENVTFYRSKTRTCSGGSIDYKWSESNDDKELKDKGYTLTGKIEEI